MNPEKTQRARCSELDEQQVHSEHTSDRARFETPHRSYDSRGGRPSTEEASEQTIPTPPVSSTSRLMQVITLPLRAAHGLHTLADTLIRIPDLADAVGNMNSELVGLRADLAGMPADSRRLADDVEVVHGVMNVMNGGLADVKASVTPVHDDLGQVRAGLAPLPDQLDRLLPKVDELSGRLDGMRTELSGQRDGMRTDLSRLPFMKKSA